MTKLTPENVATFNRYRPALEPISELYFWGTNYDFGNSPYSLFLDLIGYSDELGIGKCFDYGKNFSNLGYVELDYLADALKAYARIGADAYEFVRFMDELEAEETGCSEPLPEGIETYHSQLGGNFCARCTKCNFVSVYFECGHDLEHDCNNY